MYSCNRLQDYGDKASCSKQQQQQSWFFKTAFTFFYPCSSLFDRLLVLELLVGRNKRNLNLVSWSKRYKQRHCHIVI